jgi:hypothetical protein
VHARLHYRLHTRLHTGLHGGLRMVRAEGRGGGGRLGVPVWGALEAVPDIKCSVLTLLLLGHVELRGGGGGDEGR